MLTREWAWRALALHDPRGIPGRHELCGTPCSQKREHATQRKPWPTRSHWQDWHQYHRQFHLVAFTDRCSRATDHWPLFSRPAPHAAGRELGLFSCSIPPWFALSNNLSTTNARPIWLRFGAFLSPPASSLQFHYPTSGPAGSGHAKILPRWLLPATDRHRPPNCERSNGPDMAERTLHLIMHRTRRFLRTSQTIFPACRRPTVGHSHVAWGAPRQRFEAFLPDPHQPRSLLSRCSPWFPGIRPSS